MLNKTFLQGRLTKDPELRNTPAGVPVTTIRIAVQRDYTPKGKDKITDFINCVAWRDTAELVCKHWRKGDEIIVMGPLQNKTKDGKQINEDEVLIERCWFVGSKGATRPSEDDFTEITEDADIPF